jgi:hypothetical protein
MQAFIQMRDGNICKRMQDKLVHLGAMMDKNKIIGVSEKAKRVDNAD